MYKFTNLGCDRRLLYKKTSPRIRFLLFFIRPLFPGNIYTSPTEGIFPNAFPTLWKFQVSFVHFFVFFGLLEPSAPFCGVEYGYFKVGKMLQFINQGGQEDALQAFIRSEGIGCKGIKLVFNGTQSHRSHVR